MDHQIPAHKMSATGAKVLHGSAITVLGHLHLLQGVDHALGDMQAVLLLGACCCRETAHLAVRMLTARAAGVVLRNISQVDSFKAAWMEEYFTKVRSTLCQGVKPGTPAKGPALMTRIHLGSSSIAGTAQHGFHYMAAQNARNSRVLYDSTVTVLRSLF